MTIRFIEVMMPKRKVLFYSHDTFGLGHIRRTQKIANELADENTAILIICSSPKASDYRSQKGIEYLKLPGFTKLKTGNYIPRNLNVDISDFIKIRSEIILATAKAFEPDVFVVDKEPLGIKGELRAALEYMKNELPHCQKICGIRDILDRPEKVEKEWRARGSGQAIVDYYESVLIYGDENIYNVDKEYHLTEALRKRVNYVGYIFQFESSEIISDPLLVFPGADNDLPLVTFSLGGGEDGEEFLEVYVKALENHKEDLPFRTLVVTGPFFKEEQYRLMKKKLKHMKQVKFIDFVPNMFDVIKKSDAMVTMGGYNTFCECISLGKRPLILPRIIPREEQLIRAQIFKAKGLCDYIHPDEITEKLLLKKIMEQLNEKVDSKHNFDFNGLKNTAKFIRNASPLES